MRAAGKSFALAAGLGLAAAALCGLWPGAARGGPAEPVTVLQLVAPGHPAYLLAARTMRETFSAGSPGVRFETIDLDLPDAVGKAKDSLTKRPSMVFAVGSRASKLALESGGSVPLVYAMVLDPASIGLPAPGEGSPARVAGVSMDVAAAQQFDLMRELVPAARRIGVLYDPLISGDAVRRAQAVAKEKGLTLVAQAVRTEGEVMGAAGLILPSVNVLWAVADPTVLTAANSRALILLCLRSRKPLFAVSEGFVRSGALAAMAADPTEVGRRSGEIALHMIEGAESSKSIRSEGPPHLSLFLNRATADHIGLNLPEAAVGRARAVYPVP